MGSRRTIIISISVLLSASASILLTAGSDTDSDSTNRNNSKIPALIEVVGDDTIARLAPTRKAKRRGVLVKGARFQVLGSADGPGCRSLWYLIDPDAWICGDLVRPTDSPPQGLRYPLVPDEELTPWPYGFVKEPTIEYRFEKKVLMPVREVLQGFGFGVKGVEKIDGKKFYKTAENSLVPKEAVGIGGRISKFRGFEPLKGESVRIGWVNSASAWTYDRPFKASQYRVDKMERYTKFRIVEEAGKGADRFFRLDRDLWLSAADVRVFEPADPPQGLSHGEKWIDIDTKQQILAAYEGDRPVYLTLVSTGRTGPSQTAVGEYRIWAKVSAIAMDNTDEELEDGSDAGVDEVKRLYSLHDVPWAQFFVENYALHGVYWHDRFGNRQSHGCVNMAPLDARRLFDWTDPRLPDGWWAIHTSAADKGTLVRVR